MAAEGHAPTASEYIVHHLQHLQNTKQTSIVDFSVVNFDSLVIAGVLGVVALLLMWTAARKATSGVPGRFQALVELQHDRRVELADLNQP